MNYNDTILIHLLVNKERQTVVDRLEDKLHTIDMNNALKYSLVLKYRKTSKDMKLKEGERRSYQKPTVRLLPETSIKEEPPSSLSVDYVHRGSSDVSSSNYLGVESLNRHTSLNRYNASRGSLKSKETIIRKSDSNDISDIINTHRNNKSEKLNNKGNDCVSKKKGKL